MLTDFTLSRLILYNLSIITDGFAFKISHAVIHAHDLVFHPEFWYNILIHGAIFTSKANFSCSRAAGYLMNMSYPQEIQNAEVISAW